MLRQPCHPREASTPCHAAPVVLKNSSSKPACHASSTPLAGESSGNYMLGARLSDSNVFKGACAAGRVSIGLETY